MTNTLYLEKRGCDFFPGDPDNEESDIGNYRVQTPGYDIPGKNGTTYFLEFHCYDRYQYRMFRKDGKGKLKHPVRELVMTCACSLDTAFQQEDGTTWRDSILEREFYETPRKYTEANILDFVNSISTNHYDKIEYVLNIN